MSEWLKIFKTSGLKEMEVRDGVTNELIFWGEKL